MKVPGDYARAVEAAGAHNPGLAGSIPARATGELTYLVSKRGRPHRCSDNSVTRIQACCSGENGALTTVASGCS